MVGVSYIVIRDLFQLTLLFLVFCYLKCVFYVTGKLGVLGVSGQCP